MLEGKLASGSVPGTPEVSPAGGVVSSHTGTSNWMREAGLIVVAVIVGSWLLSYVVERFSKRWGARLQAFAAFVARLVSAAVFGWVAIESGRRGGAWLALAAVCAVVALFGFAFSGLLLWALLRTEAHERWRDG
jgi:Na+/melibiose symporter-like transporter